MYILCVCVEPKAEKDRAGMAGSGANQKHVSETFRVDRIGNLIQSRQSQPTESGTGTSEMETSPPAAKFKLFNEWIN